MRFPKRKVTLTIAGLDIKAQQVRYSEKWSNFVTIPRPMLRKLVALGSERVVVKCRGIYTDDYRYDADVNFQKGEVPLDADLFTRADYNILDNRHTAVHANVEDGKITFGRGHWEHYELLPRVGGITLTVRD